MGGGRTQPTRRHRSIRRVRESDCSWYDPLRCPFEWRPSDGFLRVAEATRFTCAPKLIHFHAWTLASTTAHRQVALARFFPATNEVARPTSFERQAKSRISGRSLNLVAI